MAFQVKTAPGLAAVDVLSTDKLLTDPTDQSAPVRLPFGDMITAHHRLLPAQAAARSMGASTSQPSATTTITDRPLLVMCGDSNTDNVAGRPGWQAAVNQEWLSQGGVFENWRVNNIGQNGSQLQGWVNSIGTGSAATAVTVRGSLWAAVNADPDVVIFCLGTNDVNQPSVMATVGVEATMRANLLTAVRFLLDNSRATVVLRMPQPVCFESFVGTGDYVDADQAAEASRRIRVVYREWVGRTPRVLVYDSHRSLFGDRCDDKTTACLDPITGAPLIVDKLHPTNLGFRRLTEGISRLLRPSEPYVRALPTWDQSAQKNALWSVTVFCSNRNTNTLDIRLDPRFLGSSTPSTNGFAPNDNRPGGAQNIAMAELIGRAARFEAIRQIAVAGNGASGAVGMLWHNTGAVYYCDAFNLVQLIGGTPDYAQLLAVNPSPALVDQTGPVTFFVTAGNAVPGSYLSRYATPDLIVSVPGGQTNASIPVLKGVTSTPTGVQVSRGTSTGGVQVDLYISNQADGRYVLGGDPNSPYGAGKCFARCNLSAGVMVGAATMDPDNLFGGAANVIIPVGGLARIRAVVTGSVSGDLTSVVTFR